MGRSAPNQCDCASKSAVAWDWIAVNPADRVEHPERPQIKPRLTALTETAHLIEEAARRDPTPRRVRVGHDDDRTRRGEMCALHREDIDLDNKVIHLRRAVAGTHRCVDWPTRSGSTSRSAGCSSTSSIPSTGLPSGRCSSPATSISRVLRCPAECRGGGARRPGLQRRSLAGPRTGIP
jgi:hypothetical protein